MRVAIDARSAVFPRRTGVGMYARELIRRLPAVDPGPTYVAWYLDVRGVASRRRFFPDAGPGLLEHRTAIPSRLFDRAVARLGLPRIEWFVGFDVLFAPNFVPPPTRAPVQVVTVHDLAFRLLPDTAPHAVPWWLRTLEHTLAVATRVIVPSASTRDDLIRLYGVDEGRIVVVPLAVDHDRYRPPASSEVEALRRRLGIGERYLLFLGLDRRKNLPAVLEAFARLPAAGRPSLVLAGAPPWEPDGADPVRRALERLPASVRADVVRAGYVPERDKPALIGGATALVYPSLYEGFGLPVLEAMAVGTPVVTSDVSSLPELVDGAGLLVDPNDAAQVADAIARVLDDDDLRERLRRAGRARAAGFTWEATARRTAEVIGHAARAGAP